MTPTATALPFDDIRALIARMPEPDAQAASRALTREATLVKPPGALGRLEDIAVWLAAWQSRNPPRIARPIVAVFAGNHGIAARGVSAYPADVTRQMVATFQAGGAAINQICAALDLGLKVFDLALEMPTADFTREAAMSERDCAATIAFGMEAVAGGTDLLCVGEMGIGNTTVAAAIAAALNGGDPADWVGRGTGLDDDGLARKRAVVAEGLALHRAALGDPLEVLRRLGGREIAAILGAVLAARMERVPVILDGFPATAAAAILHRIDPRATAHCLAGHVSAEPGHGRLLRIMGLEPVLNLGMRLGEGSGAALAAAIVKSAAATHAGMATFDQAGVSGPDGE